MSNLVSLLVITENSKLQNAVKNVFSKSNLVVISGCESNPSKALKTVPAIDPDVVLLDISEGKNGDGQFLQNFVNRLMLPVIAIADRTTQEPNVCFESLKNGAVDCIFQQDISIDNRSKIEEKIVCASRLEIRSLELTDKDKGKTQPAKKKSFVVFCEDCGARNIFEVDSSNPGKRYHCTQCGDRLEVRTIQRYKRPNFVTIIAAGAGSYSNLVRIIPRLPPELSSAILVVLAEAPADVDLFTDYLASISACRILRLKNDISLEGGCCYIGAGVEGFYLKPFSTRNTIKSSNITKNESAADLLMESTSTVFKNNTAGLFLSGLEQDGEIGIKTIIKNGGSSAVMFFGHCLHRQMGENILRKCKIDKIVGESDAVEYITSLSKTTKGSESVA